MLLLQFLALPIFLAVSTAQPLDDDSNQVEEVAIVPLEQTEAMNIEFINKLQAMKEEIKTELRQEFKQELSNAVKQTQEIALKLKTEVSQELSSELTDQLAVQLMEVTEDLSVQLMEGLGNELQPELQAIEDNLKANLNSQMIDDVSEQIKESIIDEVAQDLRPILTGLEEDTENLREMSKLIRTARTCEELASAGISRSGNFQLDPDGENAGADPINVYCDFTTRATEIYHNMVDELELEQCDNQELGCQKVPLEYEVPMSQIIALTQLSATCEQAIQFDCFMAPLMEHGNELGYWLDRNGNKSNFFHGNLNPDQPHVCRCGMDQSCVLPELPCNCDAKEPNWLADEGVITDKNILPITEFAYGPMEYEMQKAKVKIGHLKCSGRSAPTSSAVTCASLKRQGVSFSGLFNLKDEGGNLRLGYCDMEKGLDETGLEGETFWQFGEGSGSLMSSSSRPIITNGSLRIARDDCSFGSVSGDRVTFAIDYDVSQDCYLVINNLPSDKSTLRLRFNNFNSEDDCDYFYIYQGEPGQRLEPLEVIEGNVGAVEKTWTEPQEDWNSSGSITLRWKSDSSVARSDMTATVDFYG